MKIIITISFLLFYLSGISQKLTEEKIQLEISKIDSLRFNKISNYKKYRNMSSCGGSVSASFLNDTANYIYAISGVELYTSILVVYLKDNQPLRIYYYESIPEWEKFIKTLIMIQ